MELLTTVTEAGEEEGGTQATPQSAFLISILSFFPSEPRGSDGKSICLQCRRRGWIPGWGRSFGEGNGNLLQYSHLENFMEVDTDHEEHFNILPSY